MVQNFKFHKFNSEMKHLQWAHYMTEVDFTEVIEPDGYLLLI